MSSFRALCIAQSLAVGDGAVQIEVHFKVDSKVFHATMPPANASAYAIGSSYDFVGTPVVAAPVEVPPAPATQETPDAPVVPPEAALEPAPAAAQ